ncbi:hypothetical protein ACDX66_10590 [Peribacillus frigoritolerans]
MSLGNLLVNLRYLLVSLGALLVNSAVLLVSLGALLEFCGFTREF